MWQRLTQVNYSTPFLFQNIEIIIDVLVSHSRQRLTQMQYSTFFTFRHFILFFLGAHMWQRLTQVNHFTLFLLLEVEISLFIFFPHSRQRLTQMQYSTFFTFKHLKTSYRFFGCSFVAEANTSESLYRTFTSRSRDNHYLYFSLIRGRG